MTSYLSPNQKKLRAISNRKNKYGLDNTAYIQLLDTQDNRCAICRKSFGEEKHNKPHVDHNHWSGEVRGLLCFSCNSGIGHFKDDPAQVLRALNYLNKYARLKKNGDGL